MLPWWIAEAMLTYVVAAALLLAVIGRAGRVRRSLDDRLASGRVPRPVTGPIRTSA
jgi:hypothetical protein